MYRRKHRSRSELNPFISLTDILFNLILVLIFATAVIAQNISRVNRENRDFIERLESLLLERDQLEDLTHQLQRALEAAEERGDDLQNENASLQERIMVILGQLRAAEDENLAFSRQLERMLEEIEGLGAANAELQAENEDLAEREGDLLEQNASLEERIVDILGQLQVSESERGAMSDDLTLLRRQVAELSRNNFLVVELEWLTESHDLDLHVTDPDGLRFYWYESAFVGDSSRITLDNRIGARSGKPGVEMWTARELKLGLYRVEVGLWGCDRQNEADSYEVCTSDSTADVLVRHRDGDDAIQQVQIPALQSYARVQGSNFERDESLFDRLVLVAEIRVFDDNGERRVVVVPAPGLSVTRVSAGLLP